MRTWPAAGVILSPEAEMVCAFDHDIGSGNQAQGNCPKIWRREGNEWPDLKQVISANMAPTVYWYNEVIIGQIYWDHNGPEMIEAFFYKDRKDVPNTSIHDVHQAFLKHYDLCRQRYRCFYTANGL